MESTNQVVRFRESPRFFLRAWFDTFARRFPFVGLFLAILVSNLAGSFFNFFYNKLLIVEALTERQSAAFWSVAAPLYNLIAYPLCFSVLLYLLWPMIRFLGMQRRG